MNLLLFLPALAMMLSACASTAPVKAYQPPNYNGAPLMLGAVHDGFEGSYVLTVNGETVAVTYLPPFADTANLHGNYGPFQISATCNKETCQTQIDGQAGPLLAF